MPPERALDRAEVRRTVAEIAVVVVGDLRGKERARGCRRSAEARSANSTSVSASPAVWPSVGDQVRAQVPHRTADDQAGDVRVRALVARPHRLGALVNKHIKYVGSKQTEVELRIHFCLMLKGSGIRIS